MLGSHMYFEEIKYGAREPGSQARQLLFEKVYTFLVNFVSYFIFFTIIYEENRECREQNNTSKVISTGLLKTHYLCKKLQKENSENKINSKTLKIMIAEIQSPIKCWNLISNKLE